MAKMKDTQPFPRKQLLGAGGSLVKKMKILNPIRQFYTCNMTTSKVTCAFSRVGSLPSRVQVLAGRQPRISPFRHLA